MKFAGYVIAVIGFILIAGVAGSSDFYEECRAAADCVAGEPMSTLRIALQSIGGLIIIGFGMLVAAVAE